MKNQDYSKWSKPQLVKEIKKLNKRKQYGLVWDEEKVKEYFEEIVQEQLPILKGVAKNEITNTTKPNNILIEGDNYHALSVLNYTHKKKIDVIYIDPPYNLGREFTYNDKIVDKNDGYKHSKWISFMEKRLKLARELLSSEGIIFISIDDNEQAQLKLLCDAIFKGNWVATIIWQKKHTSSNDASYFSDTHDFIFVYAKDLKKLKINLLTRTEDHMSIYSNPDNDSRGKWASGPLQAKTPNPKDIYEIITPSGRKIMPPKGTSWRFSKNKFAELVEDNRIYFGKSGNNVPRFKRFLSDVRDGVIPKTIWLRDEAGDNQEAKQELQNILPDDVFSTPKPIRLIKRILSIASKKDSTVLDFFAGSGTTGHAVLELNKDDGGNRKFILCTNNEGNICTKVCYPRLKNVIKGYEFEGIEKTELSDEPLTLTSLKKYEQIQNKFDQIKLDRKKDFDSFKTELLKNNVIKLFGIKNIDKKKKGLGGNLKYFKTGFVNAKPTDKNKRIMVEHSTEMLCLKENCFEMVKEGKKFKIFKNHNERYLGIIYYSDGIDSFKKEVLKLDKKINAYVFSFVGQIDEDEFKDVRSLVTLKPIPHAILNVYKRIFPYVRTEKLSRKTRK